MQSDWRILEEEKSKTEVFGKIHQILRALGFEIVVEDNEKPWGGYFSLSEKHVERFIGIFFPGLELSEEQKNLKLSPKLLIVAPHQRLSWQFHRRRAEIWKLVFGKASVIKSKTDIQGGEEKLTVEQYVQIGKGERHRLVGKGKWGIVAEIWIHTDPERPSDEDDIVRLEDDFSRV